MNRTFIALGICILMMAAMAPATQCGAIYGVRISDLYNTPLPTGKIRVWGKVTSVSPLKLTDGRSEITVTGRTASLNDYLVIDGWWNGQFFSVFEPEMIYIPAGSFLMGNNGDEPYSYPQELPQHSVYLSAYYIGKYEVTRGEYRAFTNATGYTEPWSWADVQDWYDGCGECSYVFTQTDNHPVAGVTYYDAVAFCTWAGGHLPTEAQWERAARWTGTYANAYPWGNDWNAENCNNYWDTDPAGGGYGGYQTTPVGSYLSGASPYGCQDMAGNVWEWCKDWYGSNYYSTSPSSDPQGPESGNYRVTRGGGWDEDPYEGVIVSMRCTSRYTHVPESDWYSMGFRLAR